MDKATKILMRNKPKSTGNSGFDAGRKMSNKKMGTKNEATSNVDEKLVGDQHKLDHNKDKKIDGQDMKMVRKHGPVKQSNPDKMEPFKKEEFSYADHVAKVMSSLITKGK